MNARSPLSCILASCGAGFAVADCSNAGAARVLPALTALVVRVRPERRFALDSRAARAPEAYAEGRHGPPAATQGARAPSAHSE
jgi:hypothetical protein